MKVKRVNQQLNITLPPRIRSALEAYCLATERKRSDVISTELREFLTKEGYYPDKDIVNAVTAAGKKLIEFDETTLRAAEDQGKSDPQDSSRVVVHPENGGVGTVSSSTYSKAKRRKSSG